MFWCQAKISREGGQLAQQLLDGAAVSHPQGDQFKTKAEQHPLNSNIEQLRRHTEYYISDSISATSSNINRPPFQKIFGKNFPQTILMYEKPCPRNILSLLYVSCKQSPCNNLPAHLSILHFFFLLDITDQICLMYLQFVVEGHFEEQYKIFPNGMYLL